MALGLAVAAGAGLCSTFSAANERPMADASFLLEKNESDDQMTGRDTSDLSSDLHAPSAADIRRTANEYTATNQALSEYPYSHDRNLSGNGPDGGMDGDA